VAQADAFGVETDGLGYDAVFSHPFNQDAMFLPVAFEYLLCMGGWLVAVAIMLIVLLRLRRRVRDKSSPKSLAKLRWVHLGLAAWSFLAMLTAFEVAFALFVDHSDAFNMTNISKRWLELHIDRQSQNVRFADGQSIRIRDAHKFTKNKPRGTHRICFVGDSFTMGHGIENMADRFTDRVAAELDNAQANQFSVVNLGENGLEIAQIEGRVRKILEEGYDVDTLVYVICLNDIEYYDTRSQDILAKIQKREPKFFLFQKTYFLNWIYFRLVQFTQPEVSRYSPHLSESYQSDAWIGFRKKLDQLQSDCKAFGVDLRIVIFPFMHNLGSEYPFLAAHQKITDYCAKARLRVLDLEPVFRAHSEEDLMVNRYDAHPNKRAHAIAAEAVLNRLLDDLAQPAGEQP